MLTRLSVEVDREELREFRDLLDKIIAGQQIVEIKLNPLLRSMARHMIKEIDRWEDFKQQRW